MADKDLKSATPDTSLPTDGFLFGADSQSATDPSVYPVSAVGTTLLGSGTALTGSTVTTSSPVLNLTQTWNDGAGGTVTFTGLRFNATDTASASGSLLLDLRVGGTSKFYVNKIGDIYSNGVRVSKYVSSSRLDLAPGVTSGLLYDSATTLEIGANASSAIISAGYQGSGQFRSYRYIIGASTEDLFLTRAAAATLQLGAADAAAPVAQTLKVQSGTAGASATTVSISGTSLTIAGTVTGTIAIGHAVTGTGVSAGTLITAGSGTSWTVNNSQTVGPITAYFNSVGADFTIRGSQGSGPSAGGSIIFQVAPAGSAATTAQNSYISPLQVLGTGGITGVDGATANTLALRNGTSAQLFRVYSTYNGTNDAYGAIGAAVNLDGTSGDANTLYIGSQKKGSPTALTKLAIQVDGTTRIDFGVTNGTALTLTASQVVINECNIRLGDTRFMFWQNRTVLASPADGQLTLWNNAGSDFGRLNFGGTTSSFPALKKATTGVSLQVRLADDSGDAAFQCGTATASATALNVNGTGAASIFSVTNTNTGTLLDVINSSAASLFSIADTPAMTLIDGMTITVGTTTGTKIGTSTSQKIGFWNAAPIVQPTTAVAAATVAATGTGDVVAASTTFDGYTIPQIVKAMRNAGLLA